MTLDAEEKREERRRKDRLEKAKRNRKHELEIYATVFASIHQTANHNQLLPFHAPQGTMIPMRSPTELNSPGLTPPHSSTLQSNPHYGFVNELNDESHPFLFKAWQGKKKIPLTHPHNDQYQLKLKMILN